MTSASADGLEAYEWPETVSIRSGSLEMRHAVTRLEPVDRRT